MKIPRMTVITLGVADLARSTSFYREIFSTPPITQYEGVTFFPLPGVWLALYPQDKLAEDIGIEAHVAAQAPEHRSGVLLQDAPDEASGAYVAGRRGSAPHARPHTPFRGVTLAYNARSKQEIGDIFARVARAGAHVARKPQDTFWGGYSGYFADPDGHYWEVAWGPMFEFTEQGDLRFKA